MSEEAFITFFAGLADHHWAQSLLVILSTCFIEDPARCVVALLVANGDLGWWLAFISATIGGMAGDIGLYLIGRFGTQFLTRRGWLSQERLEWIESYFSDHAAKTIIAARYLAGARTVVFTAAGVAHYPFGRYLVLLLISAATQAWLFIQIGTAIGEYILPYLTGRTVRYATLAAILIIGIIAHQTWARRRRKKAKEKQTLPPKDPC